MKHACQSIIYFLFIFIFIVVGTSSMQAQSAVNVSAYTPAVINAEIEKLQPQEQEALYYLVKAAIVMDQIFLRQVYAHNPEIYKKVKDYTGTDKDFVQNYFAINFGPFDRLKGFQPFFGNYQRPSGANFYPEDITREEFLEFVKLHPDMKEIFESPYATIVRDAGQLKAIPYPQHYWPFLRDSVSYLQKAADLTSNASFKKYLLRRATDLLTNDYFQSDCDWVDITGSKIELVIGPYEVYEDGLFNYKAAYEAFVYMIDSEETAKVQAFITYLKDMQNNLPVDKKYLSENIPPFSPLQVADLVFSAGDAKAGVQTIAFSLPNDEKVRELKGAKQVILKNIMKAKYRYILFKIAEILLANDQLQHVQFAPFLYHVILHELGHPLGCDYVFPQQNRISVRKSLKELHSVIEETKADTVGLFNAMLMLQKGVISQDLRQAVMVTELASMFRSMRFGVADAHGGANLVQLNFIREQGGIVEKDGRWAVAFDKFVPALTNLVKEILEIQGTGDYERAKRLLDRYGKLDEALNSSIGKLKAIPVDIKPEFTTVKELGKNFNDAALLKDCFFE